MRRIMKHYILQSIVIIIDVILSIFLNIVVKLAVYGKYFEDAIQSRLSSTHSRVVVPFSTDVYRYLFGSKTELLASKEDFTKLSLSHIWYFKLNCHRQGVQLNFPIRISSSVFEKNYVST